MKRVYHHPDDEKIVTKKGKAFIIYDRDIFRATIIMKNGKKEKIAHSNKAILKSQVLYALGA